MKSHIDFDADHKTHSLHHQYIMPYVIIIKMPSINVDMVFINALKESESNFLVHSKHVNNRSTDGSHA